MSIHGVEVTLTNVSGEAVSDEELDRVYDVLDNNFSFKSVDLFMEENGSQMRFLIGVECPDGLDSDSLISGIVQDALDSVVEKLENLGETNGPEKAGFTHTSKAVPAFC